MTVFLLEHVCACRACRWMYLSLGLSSYKYFCIPSCETFVVWSDAVLFYLNTKKFIHKNKNPFKENVLLTSRPIASFATWASATDLNAIFIYECEIFC